jgi:hypothetical protein
MTVIIAAGYGSDNALLRMDEGMWVAVVLCRGVPHFSGSDKPSRMVLAAPGRVGGHTHGRAATDSLDVSP